MRRQKRSRLFTGSLLLFVGLSPAAPPTAAAKSVQSTSNKKVTKSKQDTEISFKEAGGGELQGRDGVNLSFHRLDASDGVPLTSFYGSFDTESEATAQFERELARAARILSRGKKRDKSGKIVGERAEILIRSEKPIEMFSAVIWTSGAKYREIVSVSARDNLVLEKLLID